MGFWFGEPKPGQAVFAVTAGATSTLRPFCRLVVHRLSLAVGEVLGMVGWV